MFSDAGLCQLCLLCLKRARRGSLIIMGLEKSSCSNSDKLEEKYLPINSIAMNNVKIVQFLVMLGGCLKGSGSFRAKTFKLSLRTVKLNCSFASLGHFSCELIDYVWTVYFGHSYFCNAHLGFKTAENLPRKWWLSSFIVHYVIVDICVVWFFVLSIFYFMAHHYKKVVI